MKKLILIDGYSFLFRAFYAIRNLNRSDGTPVGGLYGFSRMLIKLITDIEYSHIAVVFDAGEKTFRNDIYSKYKANRPPCPPELLPQFPLVREIVNVLNIATLEKIGYEADDIIATYTKKAEEDGFEVMIVSSDKDLMQLVDDKVKMFDGMKNEVIDEAKVKEKWGVPPKQILEILSLMGDASDNIPGVPTIGPKTASELINQYGTVENLLNHLDEIKQNKRREVLMENKDNAILSKKLVTLDEKVTLDFSIDDLKFKQYDYKKLIEFLKEQEFNSMVKGLEKAFYDAGISLSVDPIVSKNNEKIGNSVEEIANLEKIKEILHKITYDGKLYFNILTEKNDYNSKILSLSFSGNNEKIYFIKIDSEDGDLFSNNKGQNTFKKVISNFKNIFEDNSILKIGFDIKKQIKILNNYEIKINSFEDIGVISYIANEGVYNSDILSSIITNNLSFLSNKLFCELDHKKEEEIESKNIIEAKIEYLTKIEKELKIDDLNERLLDISVFIVQIINPLYFILKEKLTKEKLTNVYETIERPMTEILADMEITGIKLDIKRMTSLSKEFQNHIDELTKEIYKMADREFNIASPKQLSEVLFTKMKLTSSKKASKSGNLSTSIDVLEELANQGCEICKKILLWRHYSKLKNTYTDVLPKLVDKDDRIHTTYSNTSVITGRLSSTNPNLQNIPIKSEEGGKIRTAFVAEEGCKLVSADYKQAELRIIANYKDVKNLKEFFLSKKDIHTVTASKVFKVPEESVTSSMRGIAKAINFSIIYGTGPYGLAKRINSSNEEAKEYLKNYFETYPEVKKYIEDARQFVNEHNYTLTYFGRKCNIDIANAKPIMRSNLERLGINAPIQGTASDIIKKAMIVIYRKLKEKNFKSKLILQIHDELVVESPADEIEEITKLLKSAMEGIMSNWEVKLEVDVAVGKNLEETE